MPWRAVRCSGTRSMSLPSTRMLPLRLRMMPTMARSAVVLPTPLRPSSVTVSPSCTSRSMPCSAWLSPYQALSSRTASSAVLSVIFGSHVGGAHTFVLADAAVVTAGEDFPALQHRDLMAEVGDHLEVVLDHQHRALGCHRPDELGDHRHVLVAHAGHGLVEQQHLRLQRQGGGQFQHPLAAV